MSHLARVNKGERWRLVGENHALGPGDFVEVKIGNVWIGTKVEFSHTTKDYRAQVLGIYFYNGQPARIPPDKKWKKFE